MTTQRRRRAWCDILVNQAVATADQSIPVDILIDFPDTDVKTVVRLIGSLTVFPADFNATNDASMQIDLGIGVGSREAFTALVVPDPNVQADYPTLGWLYITTKMVLMNNSSGTLEFLKVAEINFDIRANRKVDKGVLYLVWNNTAAQGTGYTVRMVGRIRALCLT